MLCFSALRQTLSADPAELYKCLLSINRFREGLPSTHSAVCALLCLPRWLQLAKDDPDTLPGHSPAHRKIMSATFEAISKETGGKMYK
jgi:hypothetical protein